MTARVDVVYRAERDVPGWERRNAAGEVPGRWPYGLDLLGRPGVEVRAVPLGEPSRVRAATVALRGVVGGLLGGVPARRHRGAAGGVRELGVAWDENMARRMVRGAPRPQMASGVIWLTDRLRRDPQDVRALGLARLLAHLDALWVNSAAQVDPLRAAVPSRDVTVEWFPFGIDETFFTPAPWPDRPLVVSIGGDRDRDPATLFAALETVVRARPEVEVVVQTTSQAPAPRGVSTVRHLEHRALRDLYRRATVVAVATRRNLHMSGLTVSLETMATARPVVVSRTPGAEQYHEEGVTSLLVPPEDPSALADGVLSLLADPGAAERMGLAARAHLERGFTSRHMVEHLARLLRLP